MAKLKNFEGFEDVTENMKNSVKNIMHVTQQMSGEGFHNMKAGNREEIWGETTAEPTNQDSDEMAE